MSTRHILSALWQKLRGSSDSATPPDLRKVMIPAGTFTMGDLLDGDEDAKPVSNVFVSAFYIESCPITWGQWKSVQTRARNHGYNFRHVDPAHGEAHPVQSVTWHDAVKWCNARSEREDKTPVYYEDPGLTRIYKSGELAPHPNWAANGYRLPTEAEWEKAARGGKSGLRFPWGEKISLSQANYNGNQNGKIFDLGPNGHPLALGKKGMPYTSPVGSYAPNGYGLYDMAGNVWQWCWDRYGSPYSGGNDPRGPAAGSFRVLRGGGWCSDSNNCRVAYRLGYNPSARTQGSGFRTVLPMDE